MNQTTIYDMTTNLLMVRGAYEYNSRKNENGLQYMEHTSSIKKNYLMVDARRVPDQEVYTANRC